MKEDGWVGAWGVGSGARAREGGGLSTIHKKCGRAQDKVSRVIHVRSGRLPQAVAPLKPTMLLLPLLLLLLLLLSLPLLLSTITITIIIYYFSIQ